MAIKAHLAICAGKEEQFPRDRKPEIALAGRSNVGKSSLINCLVNRKGLAHTSNTPGRTQTLNFYHLEAPGEAKPFYLVDMPGYGYAKVNLGRRDEWKHLIEGYFRSSEHLKAIIQLIDLRHPPQPLDIQMTEYLLSNNFPFLLVGTKADKIAKTKVDESMLLIAEELNIDSINTLAFSAESALGRENLWNWVKSALKE